MHKPDEIIGMVCIRSESLKLFKLHARLSNVENDHIMRDVYLPINVP